MKRVAGATEDEAAVLLPRRDVPWLFALVGGRIALRLLDAPMFHACGDLAIDLIAREATRGGRHLPLHPREFDVLAALARARGGVLSRAALYEAVWHRRFDPGTNVVAVTLSRLRAKVDGGARPRLIRTLPGGYALVDPVAAG